MALIRLSVVLLLPLIVHVTCQLDDYFLPKNIKPLRYNLTVAPDTFNIDSGLFYGNVNIEFEALENTRNITIHATELTIYTYLITVTDEKRKRRIGIARTSDDIKREFYIIHLKDELEKGRVYMLTFGKFTGSLENDKAGFFYAKYKNSKNETKHMVITEFEPTDARRTFPCFDEPALKARFVVNIIREQSLISSSNEELNYTTSLGHGLFRDTFKETVLMSTYLLAFSVSELAYSEKKDRIRVLVRPDAVEAGSTNYILDESVKLLKNLERYTGIPYTLKKLDLLGVPEEYFLDGAMENWGLVVYNEKYLLCSDTSNTKDIQKCATFSGHEFAHQWFGNLVTPKSWHYMWLSEGFAAYFQYFVTALAEPTWRLDEQYVIEEFQSCLESDIAPLTEPVNFIFTSTQTFPSSQIYYYKASAIIRMTEHFMTNNLFVQSLRSYLNKHQFGSTEPNDLFREYQRAIDGARMNHLLGGSNVKDILLPWLENIGHPIVTITRNYNTGVIRFSQKTFYKANETDSNVWPIPITYYLHHSGPRGFHDTTTDLWLTKKSAIIKSSLQDSWIIANKHIVGYYRVNYDTENWKRLIHFLKTGNLLLIPPTNRAQLIDDAFYLAECSKLDFQLVFNITTYLRRETDYIPLKSFLTNIVELSNFFNPKPEYHLFKTYVKWLLHTAFTKIGLQEKMNDSHTDKLLRMLLAEWMCNFGDFHCQNFGIEHLRNWRRYGVLNISPDLQYPTLCGAIQIATKDEWNFLLQQYYVIKDETMKTQIIRALSCTDRRSMISNFMEVIFNPNNMITPDDRSTAVGTLMQFSNVGMDIVLNYIIALDKPISAYGDHFNPIVMVVDLPNSYRYKLDILKNKHGSVDLPVYYYTDDSLTDEELLFMAEAGHWLQNYSKNVMEEENVLY